MANPFDISHLPSAFEDFVKWARGTPAPHTLCRGSYYRLNAYVKRNLHTFLKACN
jgi:hypothetical protein